MKYIKDIREGEAVNEIYFVKQCQQLKSKNGKPYISVVLQDKTGTLDAKIWDINGGIDDFEAHDYCFVSGSVTVYMGQLQLKCDRVRKCREGEYVVSDYLPVSRYDIDEMYKKLMEYKAQVKNPYLSKLLDAFFTDDAHFISEFKRRSAAKSVHHGYIGGLLEHTLSVTQNCAFYGKKYEYLNRELLITVAMLHDIGKIEELSDFPDNDYTDEGNLLGHIMIGANKVSQKISAIDGFPKKLSNEVVHCILAHHGQLDYGSPKVPAMAEAMALFFSDNLDAKMETFREIIEGSDEASDWLGFSKLLETNVRRSL